MSKIKVAEIEEFVQFFKNFKDSLNLDNVCGDRSSWIDKYEEILNVYNEFAEKLGFEKLEL